VSRPTPDIAIGLEVEVVRVQQRYIGPPRYPGRRGIVLRRNSFGKNDHGGLWYVLLSARGRAEARTELFWGEELSVVLDP
jgi:hypothetical protein